MPFAVTAACAGLRLHNARGELLMLPFQDQKIWSGHMSVGEDEAGAYTALGGRYQHSVTASHLPPTKRPNRM